MSCLTSTAQTRLHCGPGSVFHLKPSSYFPARFVCWGEHGQSRILPHLLGWTNPSLTFGTFLTSLHLRSAAWRRGGLLMTVSTHFDPRNMYIVSCYRGYHYGAQPCLKKRKLLLHSTDWDKSNHILLPAVAVIHLYLWYSKLLCMVLALQEIFCSSCLLFKNSFNLTLRVSTCSSGYCFSSLFGLVFFFCWLDNCVCERLFNRVIKDIGNSLQNTALESIPQNNSSWVN